MLEILDLAGGTIAGQHDLLVSFMQGIEGMKELFLDTFLAGQELDIVDQEHVGLAVFFAKTDQLVVLNAVDIFVSEFLRREIGDAGAFSIATHVLANGMQQMGLTETDATVKKQRIVGLSGSLGDGEGCGVGKVVVISDDK